MKTIRGVAVALAGVLLLSMAGPSFAADNGEAQEETALLGTKLTLSQAIATAIANVGAGYRSSERSQLLASISATATKTLDHAVNLRVFLI